MTAKDVMLARIRSALGPDPAVAEVPRAYRTAGEEPDAHSDLVELLVDRLEDYRATVLRCHAEGIAGAVADALGDARRIVVPPGLPGQWLPAAIEVVPDEGLTAAELDEMDGVVTAATVAMAQTGTIVLDGSPHQGRRAITLVPDLHVCIVRTDQVVRDVPEGLDRLDASRPQTWISGPSATSDIELNRVEGVHGPRTLLVVLVDVTPPPRPLAVATA